MRFRLLLLAGCFIIASMGQLHANSFVPTFNKYIPQAEKVGEASLSYLLFDVYDIALYAPNGVWKKEQPYGLGVTYHLAIDADDIVARSIDEMQRQSPASEKLEKWGRELRAFLPNVEKGTVLAAVTIPGQKTIFYKDGALVGVIKDPDFGPVYMGIWLSEKTSEPKMRRQLVGEL